MIVGFENGNAEKPFVLGAMFHAEGKSGHGGQGNFIKGLQTATGIKLVMNDQDKSVLIEDPSGNKWFMDGKGSINVDAPNRISFTCTDMDINVSNNLTTTVGVNKTESVGINSSETVGGIKNLAVTGDCFTRIAGKLNEYIEGDLYSETKKGKTTVNTDQGIESSSNGSINNHAQAEIQNNSGEKSKLF